MKTNTTDLNRIFQKLDEIEKKINQSQEIKLDDFISEFDAKEYFKKGNTWFWYLRKTGFPYTKLGGQVFYSKNDLVHHLLENGRGN